MLLTAHNTIQDFAPKKSKTALNKKSNVFNGQNGRNVFNGQNGQNGQMLGNHGRNKKGDMDEKGVYVSETGLGMHENWEGGDFDEDER